MIRFALMLCILGLVTACHDSDLSSTLNALTDDRNYAADIQWPVQQNPNCPQWQRGQTITIKQSLTLPANCYYEQVTLNIAQSQLELDCNYAVLNGLPQRQRNAFAIPYHTESAPQGIAIQIQGRESDAAPLRDIRIKNCQIVNYIHGVDIQLILSDNTRQALRAQIFDETILQNKAPQAIHLTNFKIMNTHGSGIYIHRYVSDIRLENSMVKGAGGAGIYLDASSQRSVISESHFEGNGFSAYDTERRVRSPRLGEKSKREAIAIDASSHNHITQNSFNDNADGGVYLYKNCWEDAANDTTELPRLQGANQNKITNNQFSQEQVGIWVAERADRDLAGFACGDPLVYQEGGAKYYRDYAKDNQIEGNVFQQNQVGIRIMDDGISVRQNRFIDSSLADIQVGSRIRQQIGEPVTGTVLDDNQLSRPIGVFLNGSQ